MPHSKRLNKKYCRKSSVKMNTAHFKFYGVLNDFLPDKQKHQLISYHFMGTPTIKDSIEALGIPHTEVDFILINNKPVAFDHPLNHQDRIMIFPSFSSIDIPSDHFLNRPPLQEYKFILDVHLGKLARYLRFFGFDTVYQNDLTDAYIIRQSKEHNYIVLTRDIGILKHGDVSHGYYVRSQNPRKQMIEILNKYKLHQHIGLFNRCAKCNGIIHKVEKKEIEDQLLAKTKRYYTEFFQCSHCQNIYWKGSHYYNMLKFLDTLEDKDSVELSETLPEI